MRLISVIFFFIFPTTVFSGISDVYYCTTEKVVRFKNFEVIPTIQDHRFKFQRLEDRLKFGSDNDWFKDMKFKKIYDQGEETFIYGSFSNNMNYENGQFFLSMNSVKNGVVFLGTCDIF